MQETITIRAAGPDDLASIDALFARSYPRLLKADYPPSVLVTAVPLISRAQPHLVQSGRYYVAETAEGEILGAGGWSRRGDARAEVRHLVTDHAHLRRGIARALMARSMDEARAQGGQWMDCLATRTAVPFYAAVGFETFGPVEVPLRPGITFPAIRMARRL
jgi:GNAT superfamily N-acetyltransferase